MYDRYNHVTAAFVDRFFMKKTVLKNFTKLIQRHLCISLFYNNLVGSRCAILFKRDFGTGLFLGIFGNLWWIMIFSWPSCIGDFNVSLVSANPEGIYARYHLIIFEEYIRRITENFKKYRKWTSPCISQDYKLVFFSVNVMKGIIHLVRSQTF